ncbi:MAG TPA: hypothetical protein VHN36_21035 [Ilumatobacteraceae bacterium]|nr:hypothetical protein [Ilumatobacteraceae bacterium]
MFETVEVTNGAVGTTAHPPKRVSRDISAKLAGIGGLAFAGIVLLQNIIRGGTAPANGASSAEVLTHYVDHRAITFVLVATFVLSGVGLAVFLGGVMRRLMATERRGWALTGFVGATGIMALFAVVVGAEQALSVVATHTQPNIGAIEALWALHNSVFAVLDIFIATALLGLSQAGIAAGITPRAFGRLAPIGSALLLVGTFAGPAIAAGDAMPLFGLAGIGFVIWLAFLTATGLRLVRSQES